MKRLGQSDPLDQSDRIEEADFEEVRDEPYTLRSSASRPPLSRHPPVPPSSTPTLRAWWRGKSAGFKALFLIIAGVLVMSVLAILLGMVSIEEQATGGSPQAAVEHQANSITFPAGVRPEAVLAIDGGDADPRSTFRTMAAFFCPLIIDGWSIEATAAATRRHRSDATGSVITYSLTRADDTPMTMSAFRMDTGDGQPVEVLRNMRIDGKTTAGPQMWPLVHEILSQDMPQCRAYNGLAR